MVTVESERRFDKMSFSQFNKRLSGERADAFDLE
jgi:hypothetical protein